MMPVDKARELAATASQMRIRNIGTFNDRQFFMDARDLRIVCIVEHPDSIKRENKWFPVHYKCQSTVSCFDGVFICQKCNSVVEPDDVIGIY